MDGGSKVQPDSKEVVETNLAGISDILKDQAADFYFLQEVDIDAKRSFHINERAYYEKALDMSSIYACNFKCDFVPYPIPPIGKVEAGLVTMTDYQVESAKRIKLAESFSWPIKTCNLKRCMLETRIPIEGTDKELVLINFHLEAYDSGEGKKIQSRMLADKLQEEYKAGNYVIAVVILINNLKVWIPMKSMILTVGYRELCIKKICRKDLILLWQIMHRRVGC